MDMFQHHISNKEELKRINTCRQYVHAIYLSDITTAEGNHIDPEYFHNKNMKVHYIGLTYIIHQTKHGMHGKKLLYTYAANTKKQQD